MLEKEGARQRRSFTVFGTSDSNDMLYISEQAVDRSSKGSSADRFAFMSDASQTSSFDEKVLDEYEDKSNGDFSIDVMCTNCPKLAPIGYDGYEEGLWLHYIQYSGPRWTYECPYPDLAKLGYTTYICNFYRDSLQALCSSTLSNLNSIHYWWITVYLL